MTRSLRPVERPVEHLAQCCGLRRACDRRSSALACLKAPCKSLQIVSKPSLTAAPGCTAWVGSRHGRKILATSQSRHHPQAPLLATRAHRHIHTGHPRHECLSRLSHLGIGTWHLQCLACSGSNTPAPGHGRPTVKRPLAVNKQRRHPHRDGQLICRACAGVNGVQHRPPTHLPAALASASASFAAVSAAPC